MIRKVTIDAIPIFMTALLGIIYVYFFARKDYVLLVVFGLQLLRCGWAFRNAARTE